MTVRKSTGSEASTRKKIAYIIGSYPLLTTSFVDREILEAKRVGVDLVLMAIRQGDDRTCLRPEVQRLADETIYLLPVPWFSFLWANFYFLLVRFGTYLGVLFRLLTRPHPTWPARLKTLLHFGEGVWATMLLKETEIDHVHAHFADRAATVALVVARFLQIDYSLTAHANDIYLSPVLLDEKIANARFTTTCTAYNKTYLERVVGHPVELVYHGLDLSAMTLDQPSDTQADQALILSVGQLKEKKGFPFLIRACRLLKDRGYNFSCEIVGDGPERANLATLIRDLDVADRVTLCGALPNKVVMEKYTQAALFVLACVVAENEDRDGIPNVILEAMAHRLPVISTNVSGIPEVVESNTTGLLVESGNELALAEAMAQLLDQPELGQQLGNHGYHFVQTHFDIRTNIARLIELFDVAVSVPTD